MLANLHLKNLTVFPDSNFQFASGLNVVVGENGAGKTHVLKAAYSIAAVSARGERESGSVTPTKSYLETAIAGKLVSVFKPDGLGRLARRSRRGRQRAEVVCEFASGKGIMAFSFSTASKSDVTVDRIPAAWLDSLPVYLPTRELLTIYPGFVSIYETTRLRFDETWRDTCILLDAPLARGPREQKIKELLVPLEEAMGGKVELTDSGFYLNKDGVPMEMHLVAEGLRKLAMIARLIATGSLVGTGALFWDEPEANLNPKVIKVVARTILQLCLSGIQIFVASHSLFLLRELDILMKSEDFKEVGARFFGLHLGRHDGVTVQQGDSVDDIGKIDALQEELSQSDRYLGTEAH
jgi:predicted ATPase